VVKIKRKLNKACFFGNIEDDIGEPKPANLIVVRIIRISDGKVDIMVYGLSEKKCSLAVECWVSPKFPMIIHMK
jgi:hypothetical protein